MLLKRSGGSGSSAVVGSWAAAAAAWWRQQLGGNTAAAVAAAARWQQQQRRQLGRGRQLGSGSGSLAAAQPRWQQRLHGSGGGSSAVAGVSIHNVHTVSPCYRELLALLVIPTWLLHWFLRFEPALKPHSLAWNLPLSARYLRYVAAPLLVPAWGSSLDGCLTGLVTLTPTHMYGYLLYIYTCDGECEHS
jgi:hypothetical protein